MEWFPVIGYRFWTILLLYTMSVRISQEKLGEGLERVSAQIQYLFFGDYIFKINLLQSRT